MIHYGTERRQRRKAPWKVRRRPSPAGAQELPARLVHVTVSELQLDWPV